MAADAQLTLADEAIARAEANAPDGWMRRALDAVRMVAAGSDYLTTDDVWAHVDKPAEPRAAGALMRNAQRAGLIAPTDRTMRSRQGTNHSRPVRVWRSLLRTDANDGFRAA